jgi:hypothetical protein
MVRCFEYGEGRKIRLFSLSGALKSDLKADTLRRGKTIIKYNIVSKSLYLVNKKGLQKIF